MIAETLRQFHLTPLILTHMELIAVSVREEVTVCQALKLVLDRHSRQHPYTVGRQCDRGSA